MLAQWCLPKGGCVRVYVVIIEVLKSAQASSREFTQYALPCCVAPYLALTEIYDAKINLLDTINNSLTPEIKASKYGKKLQEFIDKVKDSEKNN